MSKQQYPLTGLELAVIGMGIRLPGADTLTQFWDNLAGAKDSISHFSDEQMLTAGANPNSVAQPGYVKAKGILNEGLGFEPAFFGYSEAQAQVMDPQFRVFHECVYQALAHSGYQADYYPGSIALYAGCGANPMWRTQFMAGNSSGASGAYQIDNLTSDEYFCTRIAHSLNLTGPAITVQTACSSALVAVHMAAQALIAGDCDIALAGGIEMSTNSLRPQPDVVGYFYQEGMIASPTGACRPFDSNADGTLFSDGGGCVALKRFDDALDDGDIIYGLIKATAINNDGQSKVGFTAPSVSGQSKVIGAALQMGEVDAATISYVEAHGTATNLGDPIEIEALKQAFAANTEQTLANNSCGLGSVKSNLGHLGAGAGIAGLIKVLLAMGHNALPGCVGFNQANPVLQLDNSPFNVNGQLQPWQDDESPLRAAVSAFGIGGTNAHVIVEQYVDENELDETPLDCRQQFVLPLSSTTSEGLVAQRQALLTHLQNQPESLSACAYTLQVGRRHLAKRQALVVSSLPQLFEALQNDSVPVDSQDHKIVFMFAGQGCQYTGMALDLYKTEPTFAELMEQGFSAMENPPTQLQTLFSGDNLTGQQWQEALNDTVNCQPLLLIIEWAVAKYLMSLGVTPWAMIGHSLGEYTAATVSGVLTLPDALHLLQRRAQLMAQTEPGAMLSVRLSDGVTPKLTDDLTIAAYNSATEIVVSGPVDAINDFERQCTGQDIAVKRLPSQLAFHSDLMKPILADFAQTFDQLVATGRVGAPQLAYVGNLTGDWVSAEQVSDSQYWCRHMAQAVRFEQGLATLASAADKDQLNLLLIETAPGKTLSGFAARHKQLNGVANPGLTPLLDGNQMGQVLAQLYQYGQTIDWPLYNESQPSALNKRIALPGYQFTRQPYCGRQAKDGWQLQGQQTATNNFYRKLWQLAPVAKAESVEFNQRWWLADTQLADGFNATEHFGPEQQVQCIEQLSQLEQTSALQLVYGWHLGADLAADVEANLSSFIAVLAQLSEYSGPVYLTLLSRNGVRITGAETIDPYQGMLAALSQVWCQENSQAFCQWLDISDDSALLADKITTPSTQGYSQWALRQNHWWQPSYALLEQETEQEPSSDIKTGGHYLISGGLGSIALMLARTLTNLSDSNIKLTLLSRSAGSQSTPIEGASVQVFGADVSDEAQMTQTVIEAQKNFGAIDGVIHCAGQMNDAFAPLQAYQGQQLQSQMAAKVTGVNVLHKVLSAQTGSELKFVLLMSSLSTELGGLGHGVYAAVNRYMDGFAQARHQQGDNRWCAINWDDWKSADGKGRGMTGAGGCQSFSEWLQLAGFDSQLLLVNGKLGKRLSRACRVNPALGASNSQNTDNDGFAANPLADNSQWVYQAPANEVEQILQQIWQQSLLVSPISTDDNFFKLGGDSLIAVGVFNALKRHFDLARLNFTMTDYFKRPTIAAIAEQLLERLAAEQVEQHKQRLQSDDELIEEGEF